MKLKNSYKEHTLRKIANLLTRDAQGTDVTLMAKEYGTTVTVIKTFIKTGKAILSGGQPEESYQLLNNCLNSFNWEWVETPSGPKVTPIVFPAAKGCVAEVIPDKDMPKITEDEETIWKPAPVVKELVTKDLVEGAQFKRFIQLYYQKKSDLAELILVSKKEAVGYLKLSIHEVLSLEETFKTGSGREPYHSVLTGQYSNEFKTVMDTITNKIQSLRLDMEDIRNLSAFNIHKLVPDVTFEKELADLDEEIKSNIFCLESMITSLTNTTHNFLNLSRKRMPE